MAAFAIAASVVFSAKPVHAATEDVGVCVVKATLTLGPPALQGAASVHTDLPYSFSTTSSSCVSAFGSQLTWSGGGFAQEASCESLVDLLGVSDAIGDGQVYIGVTTSGAGTLSSQEWVFSTLNADLTAVGTFVPDTSAYGNPAAPIGQCLGGGISSESLEGVVQFQLRTIF